MIERHKIIDRDAWLMLRTQDLTASDIGAAVGQDPYKSALKLYAEKTGQLMADPDTPLMRRGRWLEPAVIEAITELNPDWVITRPRFYLRDADRHIGATPDALADLGDGGITNIQCKVVSRPAYERDWADGPPMRYVLQTLTEGLLLDAARSKIAALVIDTYKADLVLHDVERHAGAEAKVQEIAAEFWKMVAEQRPPAPDYRQDHETVKALYPVSRETVSLDLTGDNRLAELLPRRAILKDEIAERMREVEDIEVEVKAKLGDHEAGYLDGWKVSWKSQTRKEQVIPASSFRVLRVSDMRSEEEKAA